MAMSKAAVILMLGSMLIGQACSPDMEEYKRSTPTLGFRPPVGYSMQSNLRYGSTPDGRRCMVGFFPSPDGTEATVTLLDTNGNNMVEDNDEIFVTMKQNGKEFHYITYYSPESFSQEGFNIEYAETEVETSEYHTRLPECNTLPNQEG